MALYKSFLRSCLTSMCHNQHVLTIVKNELVSVKLVKPLKMRLSTSTTQNGSWRLNNLRKNTISKPLKEEVEELPPTPFSINLLVKPFLFTVAFSSASIAGTAIWQYENVRKKAMKLITKNWISDKILKYEPKKYFWRQTLNKYWNQLKEGEKLFVPIFFLNVMVFLAWKVKKFEPFMAKYFCSSPFSQVVCLPMILTTFSHYNLFHLAANMYVLHDFSISGVEVLGKEQFLGLYLAAGVISSFTSYLFKALISQYSLSVGASGAIMAMIGYICTKYPDTQLQILCMPWFVFSAGAGIKCLIGLDMLGVIRRWRYLDHAGHLGGAFTGIAWCYWGNTYIWQKREPLLHWWHEIRSPTK